MLLSAGDMNEVQSTLSRVRGNYRTFLLVWPTAETECTACGFDELTQSAKDSSCATCDGIGKTLTWVTVEVQGRLQHYDFVKLAAAGIPPGIEIGDVVSYISKDVKDAVLDLRASQFGYALIDSETFRPYSVVPDGVGHADEWRVEWKRTEVDVTGH